MRSILNGLFSSGSAEQCPANRAQLEPSAVIAVLGAVLSFGGCADKAAKPPPSAVGVAYPRSDLAGVDSLDVYVENDIIHVLLAGPGDDSRIGLRYTRSEDGGASWSPPSTIATADAEPNHPHRGNDVQLAARGNTVVAVWQVAGSGFKGSGPMRTAYSEDGGVSWRAGSDPADDGGTGGHAFIDLAVDTGGAFHIVWLDSRAGKGQQGLFHARSADGGRSWSKNVTIEAKTCQCCWNTLTTCANGDLQVGYRQFLPRDMALSRSFDGGETWRTVGVMGSFDWQVDFCPHVGGGLASGQDEGEFHATVWTGKAEDVGVHYTTSGDGGAIWSQPRRLGGKSAKNSDIAAGGEGQVAAVWDAVDSDASLIYGAISDDGGLTFRTRVLRVSDEWLASHPRVIATRFGFRVLWTETRDEDAAVWAVAVL